MKFVTSSRNSPRVNQSFESRASSEHQAFRWNHSSYMSKRAGRKTLKDSKLHEWKQATAAPIINVMMKSVQEPADRQENTDRGALDSSPYQRGVGFFQQQQVQKQQDSLYAIEDTQNSMMSSKRGASMNIKRSINRYS